MSTDRLQKIDGKYNTYYYNLAPVFGRAYIVWFTCKGWKNVHRLRKSAKNYEEAEQTALKTLYFYMLEERAFGKVEEPDVITGFTKTQKHRKVKGTKRGRPRKCPQISDDNLEDEE